MSRGASLPLRVRLVTGFSLATLVVLVAAGVFVYWRIETALDTDLDNQLQQASSSLDRAINARGEMTDPSVATASGLPWQVLTTDGSVVAKGGAASATPLASNQQLAAAGTGSRVYDVGALLPIDAVTYRIQVKVTSASAEHVLVVAVRRENRDETLRELVVQLAVAGLGTLVITAFVGDRLARAALRPVERYRRQAEGIAAGSAELRLDVPNERDDEITRLGHTFNAMLSTLERALDRERQFVSEASHELRTPITLLTSRVQLALRRARTQEEHEHILAELKVDLDRLATLADQLLSLGSDGSEAAGGCELGPVAERVVNQRRLADPNHASQTALRELDNPLPVLVADVSLARILTNLLDNAHRHGAPPVELVLDQVTDRSGAPWARVTISDQGPGMPEELLSRATQRFSRAIEARTRPGAGLGLSLVASLVSAADGELRLCSGTAHTTSGRVVPVACEHGPAMTVTVLLPIDGGA